ncbi:MAG: hypothetical protein AB1480_04110 [Nitrospirota bacterium]
MTSGAFWRKTKPEVQANLKSRELYENIKSEYEKEIKIVEGQQGKIK